MKRMTQESAFKEMFKFFLISPTADLMAELMTGDLDLIKANVAIDVLSFMDLPVFCIETWTLG